ncbi:hypothetical protein D9M68_673510 [compost metagenome]
MEEHQQQGVGRQRQAREGDGVEPGQGRRGDGQRHQVIGNEGVGGAPGEIQQHAVDDQVEAQLHRILQLGHRPGPAQAQRRAHAKDQRDAEGHAQCDPGQLQQLGLVGEADRAGLGGQDKDADQGQPQQVLAAGRQ